MIRWLDYNDTWLAAEWGHPSDNLGGILAVADYISRVRISEGKEPLKVREVLEMMIKAHEIQGVLALENSLNRVGLDHVLYVKVATTAVVAKMLVEHVKKSLMHYHMRGLIILVFVHIVMLQILGHVNHGQQVTRRAAVFILQ